MRALRLFDDHNRRVLWHDGMVASAAGGVSEG